MVDELHLFGGRIHLPAVDLQLVIGQVDGEAVVGHLFVFVTLVPRLAAAAQHRVDTGHHLFALKGLDHVIVSAQLQAQHLVEHLPFGGKHDDGASGLFADLPADLPAVQAGQHNVQEDKVGGKAVELFQRAFAVVDHLGGKALFLYVEPQKFADIGIIVYDEDLPNSHFYHLFYVFVGIRAECPCILSYFILKLWQMQEKQVNNV